MTNMMGTFTLLIGLFTLYSAIVGKGPAFKSDYPKEMKESHDKLLRKFLWVFSPILIAQGALDLTENNPNWLFAVFFFVLTGLIAVYLVIFYKRYGNVLKKQREDQKNINKPL